MNIAKKLRGVTAGDLMTENPLSLSAAATVKEAVAFLTDKGFSAAPVIDAAGRPVGVLSRSDILVHNREALAMVDRSRVRDIMTPAVFSVALETPAQDMVENMVGMKVRRLFVSRDDGVLVGVISALDVLRYLCRKSSKTSAPQVSGRLTRSPK